VGPDGKPQKAEIEKTSGFTRLDERAIKLAMTQRFTPATVNGVATQSIALQNFVWKPFD
jgi:protein TonB